MLMSLGAILALMAAAATPASAETAAAEPAIAISHTEPQLKWGPCPPFIPEGCEIAVLHGDPAQENADIFFKVPGGSTVPSHWHTSAERMTLVAGEMTVTYDGQAPVILKPGMYAYGPAKLPHSAACAAGAACVLFIAFEAPIDAVPTEAAEDAQP